MHTGQLSLFDRDCPYFDPKKEKERFYHVTLFMQISVCSINVSRKFRKVPIFLDSQGGKVYANTVYANIDCS